MLTTSSDGSPTPYRRTPGRMWWGVKRGDVMTSEVWVPRGVFFLRSQYLPWVFWWVNPTRFQEEFHNSSRKSHKDLKSANTLSVRTHDCWAIKDLLVGIWCSLYFYLGGIYLKTECSNVLIMQLLLTPYLVSIFSHFCILCDTKTWMFSASFCLKCN